ncbi:MAG: uracil phosphoribosyltransferase [Flavobacteriales bacterium]|nr:MAG: uracil phosphoribosyltransferase [Flavobacteriales bacterium]
MIIHNFCQTNSVLNNFIKELRSTDIQRDAMRFRQNIERVTQILAYELSKELQYKLETVQTPLGKKEIEVLEERLVICSVLRAGLTMHGGLLRMFDTAENAFISAYRNHKNNEDAFEVKVNYMTSPNLEGKLLLLADPMLVTGKTLENVLQALEDNGKPKQIHILSIIGAKEGIAHIKNVFPEDSHLWIAAIDPTLTKRGYIIPGLGDAGDLAYGVKQDRK